MAAVSVCALALGSLRAQPPSTSNLTLKQAVDSALRNYPAVRVSQEQINAAAAGIRLAQTAYLPRVDALAQINRATRNTFYGLLLPQGIIPGVDGVHTDNLGSVWDSGVGLLVTWQPFDFGLRRANVDAARSAEKQAQAAAARTQYDISVATADAFLTVIAANQTAEAAQAAVDSWQILKRSIHALTSAELRPGADESRLDAESAMAATQLAKAQQAIEIARANLAKFVGLESTRSNVDAAHLLDRLPANRAVGALEVRATPAAAEQAAVIEQQKARLESLKRTYYPQFAVQGVAAARGTGLETDGGRSGGLNGLAPTTQNYGLGLTVTFPVMDRFSIQSQEAAQIANVRVGQAQYDLIAANLQAQFATATAALDGARLVAASTPVGVSAASTALDQATARYKAGLAPIDDVAQAQRLFVEARIDDSLARLNVWRALLAVEAARGNIQPFLDEAVQ